MALPLMLQVTINLQLAAILPIKHLNAQRPKNQNIRLSAWGPLLWRLFLAWGDPPHLAWGDPTPLTKVGCLGST